MVLFLFFQLSAIGVHIDSLIDCADVVIDDLHEQRGVLAQPKTLNGLVIYIPVEHVHLFLVLSLNHTEVEVKFQVALALISSVLVDSQLHHFEVIEV